MKSQRKFSTGTLGRIAEHADTCRQFLRAQHPLANEFIAEIQGKEYDPKVWQRFEDMTQLKAEFQKWLEPPAPKA